MKKKLIKNKMIKNKTTIIPKNRKVMYFPPEVNDAIVEYVRSDDHTTRNKIYNTRIKYSFEKLAENVLNNWKFPYVTDTFRNKKVEVVSHLMLNLEKYDIAKGNAFSYFTYAARNYLIIYNNSNFNKLKSEVRINLEESKDDINRMLDIKDFHVEYDNFQDEKKEFVGMIIEFFDNNLQKIFKKQVDLKIGYAILQLIQNYEDIENFNKKNIYILIKELTNSRAQNITRILNKMKSIYCHLLHEYNSTGEISMKYGIIVRNSGVFFK